MCVAHGWDLARIIDHGVLCCERGESKRIEQRSSACSRSRWRRRAGALRIRTVHVCGDDAWVHMQRHTQLVHARSWDRWAHGTAGAVPGGTWDGAETACAAGAGRDAGGWMDPRSGCHLCAGQPLIRRGCVRLPHLSFFFPARPIISRWDSQRAAHTGTAGSSSLDRSSQPDDTYTLDFVWWLSNIVSSNAANLGRKRVFKPDKYSSSQHPVHVLPLHTKMPLHPIGSSFKSASAVKPDN
jgi:hypothetical protein